MSITSNTVSKIANSALKKTRQVASETGLRIYTLFYSQAYVSCRKETRKVTE